MRCMIPEISWHNREPVLSLDIQLGDNNGIYRLATGGSDYHVLIWQCSIDDKGAAVLEVVCDLTRHQKAVNAVRFSPNGLFLASADDDANIIIWTLKTDNIPLLEGDNPLDKETWIVYKILRGHKEDVYDLCWSPNSDKIVTGSIDNTAIMWDALKGKFEHIFTDHKGFVQGVTWDPKGQFIATLSSDRICRVFDSTTKQVRARINKGLLPVPENHRLHNKEVKYFHDDTFKSYFRRLAFSPDGSLIITPAGCVETDECKKDLRGTYLFTLDNLTQPAGILPLDKQCSVAIRFCPILFELQPNLAQPYVNLPYRMVFAIATETDILLYDTQQSVPFALLKNVHYTRLTDIAWSSDGRLLAATSTDGYCTILTFSPDELGIPYVKEESEDEKENTTLNISGIEDLDAKTGVEEETKETPKKSSFLLKWAKKAKDDAQAMKDIAKMNIKDVDDGKKEKINVLTVRRAPKTSDVKPVEAREKSKESQSKNGTDDTAGSISSLTTSENLSESSGLLSKKPEKYLTIELHEPIEITDSPVKEEPKKKTPNCAPIKINFEKKSDIASRTAGAKPIAVRRKPRNADTTPKKTNPLLTFLSRSAEKKPIDDEARDAWKCESKQPEKMETEDIDDTTVPDLELKIDENTSTQDTSKISEIIELEDSMDVDSVSATQDLKKAGPSDGKLLEELQLVKKAPRRIPLITLSSPKTKKHKNT